MSRTDKFKEICDIADSICDENVTPEQVHRLETLLADNEEAQRFYSEYIGMHVHMASSIEPNMEVIRRRMQVEEVIVRPVGSGQEQQNIAPDFPQVTPSFSTQDPTIAALPNTEQKNKAITPLLWGVLFVCLVLVISLIFLLNRSPNDHIAELISGRLSSQNVGQVQSGYLDVGDYTAEKMSILKLFADEQVELAKHAKLTLVNRTEIELHQGSLSIKEAQGTNLKIKGPNFMLYSEGAELTVNLDHVKAEITSGKDTILMPKRWRPKHYWSFDSNSDRALDLAGNAHGVVEKGAKRVQGLLGNGAFEFDNGINARLNVGSGGGTAPATGSFAVVDGVTIEALIKPEYSGKLGELDEIFRKDQTDQSLRMLLSFQHDKGKYYLKPEGDVAESLSFGLYLVGQGYNELKLPLDGKNGRPSLAQLKDGKAHHVVATYNVSSGLKAIFIDGKMHAHYQYPAGSKMLSGGSGMANIGNSPNALAHEREAYHGVIDEVAFYDFALPEFMIEQHYRYIQQGLNYFGVKPNANNLPDTLALPLPNYQTFIIDPLTGLPAAIK